MYFQVWPWILADQGIYVAYWKESLTGLEQFLKSRIRYSHWQKMNCLQMTVKLIGTIRVPSHLMRRHPWDPLYACQHPSESKRPSKLELNTGPQSRGWEVGGGCLLAQRAGAGARFWSKMEAPGSVPYGTEMWVGSGLHPSCCQSTTWQSKQKASTQDFILHTFFNLKNMRNFESGVPLLSKKGGSVYLVLL